MVYHRTKIPNDGKNFYMTGLGRPWCECLALDESREDTYLPEIETPCRWPIIDGLITAPAATVLPSGG